MNVLEIGPTRGKRQMRSWKTLNCVPGPQIDYVKDITRPLKGMPKFDLIYMSHVLEHIPWWMVVSTLRNLHAILVPGGNIEIWVPDFDKLVQVYKSGDISVDKFRMHNPQADPMLWLEGRIFAGTTFQPKIYSNLSVWHKSLHTEEYLGKRLVQAGFSNPRRLEKPRGYDHGWINLGMAATA